MSQEITSTDCAREFGIDTRAWAKLAKRLKFKSRAGPYEKAPHTYDRSEVERRRGEIVAAIALYNLRKMDPTNMKKSPRPWEKNHTEAINLLLARTPKIDPEKFIPEYRELASDTGHTDNAILSEVRHMVRRGIAPMPDDWITRLSAWVRERMECGTDTMVKRHHRSGSATEMTAAEVGEFVGINPRSWPYAARELHFKARRNAREGSKDSHLYYDREEVQRRRSDIERWMVENQKTVPAPVAAPEPSKAPPPAKSTSAVQLLFEAWNAGRLTDDEYRATMGKIVRT